MRQEVLYIHVPPSLSFTLATQRSIKSPEAPATQKAEFTTSSSNISLRSLRDDVISNIMKAGLRWP